MRLEAVIFDLDGVICSTDQYHFQAWKTIADRLGIPFDETQNNLLRGVSRMDSLDIILGERRDQFAAIQKSVLANRKNEIYRALLHQMTPEDVADEVRATLIALRKRGIPLAIGSSSKNAKFILERLQITNMFDVIVDGEAISRSKPDPEVFLLAAQRLGVEPSRSMVVEDAAAGIQAARIGHFVSVAIGPAVANVEADAHINRLDELLTFIDA